MSKNSIDNSYEDYCSIYEYLMSSNRISDASSYQSCFAKFLIVSIAGFFEKEIVNILQEYAKKISNLYLSTFIYKQALNLKYHTLFAWGDQNPKRNVDRFLGLFGDEFKGRAKEKIRLYNLEENMNDFIEIGNLRNTLVHEGLSSYNLSKTPEEVMDLYKKSLIFINFLRKDLFSNCGFAFLFDLDKIFFNEETSEETIIENEKRITEATKISENSIKELSEKTFFLKDKATVIIISRYSHIYDKEIASWLSDANIHFDYIYPESPERENGIKKQDIVKKIKDRYTLICDTISCI